MILARLTLVRQTPEVVCPYVIEDIEKYKFELDDGITEDEIKYRNLWTELIKVQYDFGRTEECDVIDFSDNIYRLGKQQTYMRFKNYWDKF